MLKFKWDFDQAESFLIALILKTVVEDFSKLSLNNILNVYPELSVLTEIPRETKISAIIITSLKGRAMTSGYIYKRFISSSSRHSAVMMVKEFKIRYMLIRLKKKMWEDISEWSGGEISTNFWKMQADWEVVTDKWARGNHRLKCILGLPWWRSGWESAC